MRGQDIHANLPLLLEEIFAGGERQIEYTIPIAEANGLIRHQKKTLNVKIPAQLNPQKPLRLKGQGAPGIGGAQAGDLLIEIQVVPHPDYTLRGKDLSRKLLVMPWQAVLGDRVNLTLPNGQAIRVNIPEDSTNKTRLKLSKQGLGDGDLYLELSIDLPDQHSEKARQYYRQLADEYKMTSQKSTGEPS